MTDFRFSYNDGNNIQTVKYEVGNPMGAYSS
jgi:hypothetical protein